jgi:hypothetical protein
VKKLFSALFLAVSTLVLNACQEEVADTSACLSLEFHRFKLGKFIFDVPSRVHGSSEFEGKKENENFRKSFKPFSREIRRSLTIDNVQDCQLKELAPYDAGSKLSVTYWQNQSDGDRVLKIFQRKDKDLMELWTATFYIRACRQLGGSQIS